MKKKQQINKNHLKLRIKIKIKKKINKILKNKWILIMKTMN